MQKNTLTFENVVALWKLCLCSAHPGAVWDPSGKQQSQEAVNSWAQFVAAGSELDFWAIDHFRMQEDGIKGLDYIFLLRIERTADSHKVLSISHMSNSSEVRFNSYLLGTGNPWLPALQSTDSSACQLLLGRKG